MRLPPLLTELLRRAYNSIRGRPRLRAALMRMGLDKVAQYMHHRLVRRTFRHMQALAPRGILELKRWQQHFDTPPSDWIEETARRQTIAVHAWMRIDAGDTAGVERSLHHLRQSIGVAWRGQLFIPDAGTAASLASQYRQWLRSDSRFSAGTPTEVPTDGIVVLTDSHAWLRPHALTTFTEQFALTPDAWVAYSDEETPIDRSHSCTPWFKPAYSPLLIRQGRLLGRVVAVNTAVADVHRALIACANTPDAWHEALISLALRAGPSHVTHIPHVLFQDRNPLPAITLSVPGIAKPPRVSIIIPTRDRWDLLEPCLRSIRQSAWPRAQLEIIIIDNGSTDITTCSHLDRLHTSGEAIVIRDEAPFNWSRLNNIGVRASHGEILVFLNNDTEVHNPDWLTHVCHHASQSDVGVVGSKLLYPDLTVQHGGTILGMRGLAMHAHLYLDSHAPGYQGMAQLTREVAAVTGACLAVRRSVFDEIGGFREQFRVAFNDVVFCIDALSRQYRNVCIGDALMIHHESKSRGYDDTPEKIALLYSEASMAWDIHARYLRADPAYSPNLSLDSPYEPAFAPRRPAVWHRRRRPCIMMLSWTHAVGHGVAVVMAIQADALVKQGYHVVMAGPASERDFPYPQCERVMVSNPEDAAFLAAERGVNLIIAHTPPFYSVTRWTGNYPPVIAYDYGEPPADWFPDANERRGVQLEKDRCLRMAHARYAISKAVANESTVPMDGVIELGNSHLGQWSETFQQRRIEKRKKAGWDDYFVILNVCRFHESERHYKGIDTYTEVLRLTSTLSLQGRPFLFVQAGKGREDDVHALQASGLTVVANPDDSEIADLYCAADAYLNFSRWEGYNLGIAQALAMGLPVLASDIEAHRAFQVDLMTQPHDALEWLLQKRCAPSPRAPRLWPWDAHVSKLLQVVSLHMGHMANDQNIAGSHRQ